METKDNFYILFSELSRFANESAAVSDLEEKKNSVVAVLSALNRSICNKTLLRTLNCEDERFIANVLFVLQVFVCQGVRIQAISLLSKLCTGPDEEKYLLYIVHAGGTRVILQALRAEYSENVSVDELLFKMHKLLCKLAPYDRRFTLRARLSQCIPITVSILRVQIAHLQSFIGPRPPPSRASTTGVTGTTVVNTANNSRGGLCPPPSRRSRRRPSYALRRPSQSRVPSSLAANLRVLLTTLRCYCGRRGRSNSATIGRLGTVNVLLRALALTAGLPHIRRTSTDTMWFGPRVRGQFHSSLNSFWVFIAMTAVGSSLICNSSP